MAVLFLACSVLLDSLHLHLFQAMLARGGRGSDKEELGMLLVIVLSLYV